MMISGWPASNAKRIPDADVATNVSDMPIRLSVLSAMHTKRYRLENVLIVWLPLWVHFSTNTSKCKNYSSSHITLNCSTVTRIHIKHQLYATHDLHFWYLKCKWHNKTYKVHPRTGHDSPGEKRYSSTLSLTLVLEEEVSQRHARPLYSQQTEPVPMI